MKGIQFTLLFIFSMGIFSPLMAQGPDDADMGNILDFLQSRIDLSDEQIVEIEAIIADYEAEKEALGEQEFDSVLEKMKAYWDLKLAFWEQIKSVLTEEQLAELGMRGGDRGDHDDDEDGDRDGHGDHDWRDNPCHPDSLDLEGLGAAIQAYKAENIEPAMRELRASLDESISEEDQARIAELRTSFANFKAEMEALKEEARQEDADRRAIWERMKELKEAMQADHEALKELTERYREDIKAAFESMSDQREQWTEDMHAIKVEYLGEECANRRHGRRGHEGRRGERNHRGNRGGHHRGGKKAARFLLLDPEGEGLADNPAELPNHTLSVSPNPAVSYTTITYKVVNDARITIFLQDGKGNFLKQVVDGQKEAGTYTVEVDLSSYKTGSYYFTLSDGAQLISQPAIITKN